MTRLLLRAHTWIHDAQRSRRARIVASVLLTIAVLTPAFFLARTAWQLDAQRTGILEVLRESSIAKGDPVALQLRSKRTITANGRDYGGAGAIPNPDDLFNDKGEISMGARQDLAWRLLLPQVPVWMPFVVVQSPAGVILGSVAVLAALLTLVWIGLGGHILEWGVAAVVLGALCWYMEWQTLMRAVIGMALIVLLFAVLWRLAQALLEPRGSVVAVARTTVMEGVRSMAAVGFAAPVVIFLPILALSREPTQGLYQAIPGFLDWGHTVVYASAALLVIIFGCATTAFEIRDRQVWTVLTKPVSRLGWMLGKWMGAMTLGTVVLLTGGLSLYVGAHYMAAQQPISDRDAREVRDAVMVARANVGPDMLVLGRDRLEQIVEETMKADPSIEADIKDGKLDRQVVRQNLAVEKQREFLQQQRQIPPGQSREYTFRGLNEALNSGSQLALRYTLHAGADDSHQIFPLIIEFRSGPGAPEGATPWDMRTWTPSETYSYEIDPKFIDADGTLVIRLFNAGTDERDPEKKILPGLLTIYFDAGGLEVMYPKASFASNLTRAMMVDVCKIAFLAALAVVAATILSFPVAVLLAFGIYAMATLTPFLAQSLEYYDPDRNSGWVIFVFQWVIKVIAMGVKAALGAFAITAPSDMLAQGKVISWEVLAKVFLLIGIVWTGLTMLIGWGAARNKEIAVYSGQS